MGFKRYTLTRVCFVVIHVIEKFNILIQNTALIQVVSPNDQCGFGILFSFKLQMCNIAMLSEPAQKTTLH